MDREPAVPYSQQLPREYVQACYPPFSSTKGSRNTSRCLARLNIAARMPLFLSVRPRKGALMALSYP